MNENAKPDIPSRQSDRQSDLISICDEIACVEVAPSIGGALASFSWRRDGQVVDWLRRASAAGLASRSADAMGCFPLIPYSNRIRNSRFDFMGRRVQLPGTPPLDPHFEHGHGWRNPWTVVERDNSAVRLQYRHVADAWPWTYLAEQSISLRDGALSIDIRLQNLSPTPMPAGIGLHPYFPSTPMTRITAEVSGMWQTNEDVLPTTLVAPPKGQHPGRGIDVTKVDLDTVFTGWSRHAHIAWPEEKRRLDMVAQAPLNFLVIYTPPGEDFFCAEPVSNVTDAFNLMTHGVPDTGCKVLETEQTLSARVCFSPTLAAD